VNRLKNNKKFKKRELLAQVQQRCRDYSPTTAPEFAPTGHLSIGEEEHLRERREQKKGKREKTNCK
jgi:hypothetical protein